MQCVLNTKCLFCKRQYGKKNPKGRDFCLDCIRAFIDDLEAKEEAKKEKAIPLSEIQFYS